MHMKHASSDEQGLKSNTSLPNHIFIVGKVVRLLVLATVSRDDAVSIAEFFLMFCFILKFHCLHLRVVKTAALIT